MANCSDEVIWQIINHQFCSFKTTLARERNFCQNPYNVTGLCLRSACPLANSRYATIREEEGKCYLYIKTIERAHTPNKLWQKIKLPNDYTKALELVSKELEYFPKYLVHRNKQRLTKIHQMLIRMRKLRMKAGPKIVSINTNEQKVDVIRERKALKAANIEKAIEKELLERLSQVTEEGIYNYPETQYMRALGRASRQKEKEEAEGGEVEGEDELEDGMLKDAILAKLNAKKNSKIGSRTNDMDDEEEDDEEEMLLNQLEADEDEDEDGEDQIYEDEDDDDNNDYNVEFIEDFDESDDDEEEDIEDFSPDIPSSKSGGGHSSSSSSSSSNYSRGGDSKDTKRKLDSGSSASAAAKKKIKGKGTRVDIEYEEDDNEKIKESIRSR